MVAWTFQKISVESKFEVHIHVKRSRVVSYTSAKAAENLQVWQRKAGGPNVIASIFLAYLLA